MGKSLKSEVNRLTFADIELGSNLSEKSSKQIANFINDKFDVENFNINYSEDFDVLTINISSDSEYYNISIVIFTDIKGKNILKLCVDGKCFESVLIKNIRTTNLTDELDDLYNEMLSNSLEY